jgi:hypothetical protein
MTAERYRRSPWLAAACVACFAVVALPFSRPSANTAQAFVQAQAVAPAQTPVVALSDAEIEAFLQNARVVRTETTKKGITGSLRATLTDGRITHDAQIQTIDESKREFRSVRGTEFNFRDSWMFNVAAYKLDRMLGLNLVPVSVKRRWRTEQAAFTWWIDDVLMDEGDRLKGKVAPSEPKSWNEQMQLVRLFDQLIYNIDRNLGNLLIARDWRVWAIDHTRAFRSHETLKSPENVTRCDSQVLERLKQLDKPGLERELGDYLDEWQIGSLLARRDLIVSQIEKSGATALFTRTK